MFCRVGIGVERKVKQNLDLLAKYKYQAKNIFGFSLSGLHFKKNLSTFELLLALKRSL